MSKRTYSLLEITMATLVVSLIAMVIIALLASRSAHAGSYKCENSEGKVSYSFKPCTGQQTSIPWSMKVPKVVLQKNIYDRELLELQRQSVRLAEERIRIELIRAQAEADFLHSKARQVDIDARRFNRASQTICPSWKERDFIGVCR